MSNHTLQQIWTRTRYRLEKIKVRWNKRNDKGIKHSIPEIIDKLVEVEYLKDGDDD